MVLVLYFSHIIFLQFLISLTFTFKDNVFVM